MSLLAFNWAPASRLSLQPRQMERIRVSKKQEGVEARTCPASLDQIPVASGRSGGAARLAWPDKRRFVVSHQHLHDRRCALACAEQEDCRHAATLTRHATAPPRHATAPPRQHAAHCLRCYVKQAEHHTVPLSDAHPPSPRPVPPCPASHAGSHVGLLVGVVVVNGGTEPAGA
ncbi:hypothetical protein E2C01_099011 [Portunus trituberculatus]|uniref:Uncharacterized protein n=1 Tax=Portunus trituberculatus TaxID=210409 RepID=A0A5B7KFK3_PORTR|nr:hypothetical protein [Portunus trituberculatus]